jgi:hypothetical protein
MKFNKETQFLVKMINLLYLTKTYLLQNLKTLKLKEKPSQRRL